MNVQIGGSNGNLLNIGSGSQNSHSSGSSQGNANGQHTSQHSGSSSSGLGSGLLNLALGGVNIEALGPNDLLHIVSNSQNSQNSGSNGNTHGHQSSGNGNNNGGNVTIIKIELKHVLM